MNEFDKVGLYDHNAESYKKVRDAFLESDVVGIVHATGTGKSYNALQLAYDNKEKKILWLVPSNAIVEHIINSIDDNPNLDMKRDFPNLEFMIYPNLVGMNTENIEDLDIDLLILDEFHHIGAPVWGARVDSIIETHPDIKVFGMTAYTVRDRGTSYERNMALDEGDELFSDNIVSRYDLCDAMIDGVLPKPIYRSSYVKLIDMTRELEDRVKRLEASGRDCSLYNTIINDCKKRLHEAPSVSDVVVNNIKPNGKYIYFCPPAKEDGVNDIETIKKEALEWFKKIAPEEDIVFYTSLSEMKDSGKSNREAFYDDVDLDGNKVDNKLRVMFCVNQYNEGVHAPNIDGVIMGRGTCSDIVFFEQLGRALSVSGNTKKKIDLYSIYSIERLRMMCALRNLNYNGDNSREELIEKLVAPVIIDLAGNIDFIKKLEDNLKDRIKELQEKGDGTLNRRMLTDASFDLDTFEVDLFNILTDLKRKTEMTWDDWYKLAVEYYEEHGDLEVSDKYITKNNDKLGKWIKNQRIAYKNIFLSKNARIGNRVPLTAEQVKKLESIGMIWDVFDLKWNKMYELSKQYFQEHGNLDVPNKFVTKNGEKLGFWIQHQRHAYKNKTLSDEKIKKLESIGMKWGLLDSKWNKMYELACEYYEKHGNLDIPQRYITSNGEKLGSWFGGQRIAYNEGRLSKEREFLLKKIGYVFDNLNDYNWNKMYELACEYYEEYGDLDIPQRYITSNGEKLGVWIGAQRTKYKNGDLINEQVKKLESIGMIWNTFDLQWDKNYELAKKYYLEHGNLSISCNCVSENEEKLYIWISNQRQMYKKGKLSQDKINLLNSIGMKWDVLDSQWNKMYELASEYYQEYGKLDVPRRYVTKNGDNLGVWISRQRKRYKDRFVEKKSKMCKYSSLTDEQVKLLENIGMIWNTRKNKSDIEELCIDNNIDMRKNKCVISHISYIEFKVKLSYLKDKGISIVDNGILHEIFSMSNINMKTIYGVSLEDLVNMYKEKNK